MELSVQKDTLLANTNDSAVANKVTIPSCAKKMQASENTELASMSSAVATRYECHIADCLDYCVLKVVYLSHLKLPREDDDL